jgi:cytochrome c biogenesis protein CcmG, thiol:disulfide interchange protein DsbE
MRVIKLIGVFLLTAALGALAGAALWHAPGAPATPSAALAFQTTPLTAAPAPVVGAPAPDFSAADPEGASTALSDLRGKTVILNFWATWCDPCREELPLLNRIAAAYGGSLAVLAVETGDPADLVRAFAGSLELEQLRVLTDPAGRVGDLYLVRGLPTTFFIDPAGVIQRIKIGTLDSAELESILSKMGVTP